MAPAKVQTTLMRRAIAVVGVAAALAGCAGGDDFGERAAGICADKEAELAKVPRPRALILFEDYLARALPIVVSQRNAVADVDGSDSGDAKKMLDRWDDVISALRDMQEGAKAGSDIGIVIPLRRAAAAEKEADAAARAAGADECAGFNPITP